LRSTVALEAPTRAGDDVADYGVTVTWGDSRTGREAKALELFMEAVNANEKAVSDGRIESWDAIFYEPNGSAPAGAVRYYGTQEQIDTFIRAEDIQEILIKGELYLENFGYRRFMMNDALAEGMARYGALIQQL
jgi:hypothetical protein